MHIAVAITLIISAMTIVIVLTDTIKSYLIKKEQIKADALVKAEEIKAKNQYEIEKLMHAEQQAKSKKTENDWLELSGDERKVREKINGD